MCRRVPVFVNDPAPWATLEPYEPRPEVVAHFSRFSQDEKLPLYVVVAWPWLDKVPKHLLVRGIKGGLA